MNVTVLRILIGVSTALLLAAAAAPANSAAGQLIAPADLQADLRLAVEAIERNHPDLSHSVDRPQFVRAVEAIERQLIRPMSQAEAWRIFAQLNPLLADGHLFVGFADWRTKSERALRSGVGFFPFEVALDGDGNATILAELGGAGTPLAGTRIKRINGIDARQVARELLARAHGDTPAFRAALVSQRWWFFYHGVYGAPATFELVLDGTSRRNYRLPASRAVPSILQREADFARLFSCELLPNRNALLTLSSFYWPEKDRFFAFTRNCFERMRASGVRTLIIDVRNNGGGDDDMWKDGILSYIADRPYKAGSNYTKRVLEQYRDEGEVTGQIVKGTIESATNPVPDEPLRFAGDVYVLVGPLTYSSAVLFSNVVQDFGFGVVAGTGGAVRSRQSGSVQTLELPNTGLTLFYPRFVLSRPGSVGPVLVQPDLPIEDDPLRPRASIDALLAALERLAHQK